MRTTAQIEQVTKSTVFLLKQLSTLLEQLDDSQYTKPLKVLSNASIGQHIRHVIEFFLELNTGYAINIVNYDARKRNLVIETNKASALAKLHHLIAELKKEDKPLLLLTDFAVDGSAVTFINTNYGRELVYNLEHTVHHMALLRIGVNALTTITLPENFGVAMSTLKYRQTCAQ